MSRVSVDIDPRVLSKLRALANRRRVSIDVVVGEFLGSAVRSSAVQKQPASATNLVRQRSNEPIAPHRFGLIEVDYPELASDPDDEANDEAH